MQKANEEEKQSRENAYEYKDVYGTIRKFKSKRKIEKKNAVQSFGDLQQCGTGASGSCAQHLERGVKNRNKSSLLCTKRKEYFRPNVWELHRG